MGESIRLYSFYIFTVLSKRGEIVFFRGVANVLNIVSAVIKISRVLKQLAFNENILLPFLAPSATLLIIFGFSFRITPLYVTF